LMDNFQYGEAGRQVYEFFWSEYCDWYLEISKIAMYRGDAASRELTRNTLVKVLDDSLRLLHPFIPFVTEETWGYLKKAAGDADGPAALMIAPWPTPGPRDEAAEADMETIMSIVRAIRNARADYDVKPGHPIPALISAGEREGLVRAQAEVLCALARLDPAQLTVGSHLEAPAQALTLVAGSVTTYLPMSGLVDLAAEVQKLSKELAETEAQIERSLGLLSGPFAQKAPAVVVQRERDKQAELQERAASLRKRLADLS